MNTRDDRPVAGEWIVPAVSYVDPQRRFCRYCGRPIARGFWRTWSGDEPMTYCDARHAELDAAQRQDGEEVADDRAC
jgi:hypothetical protein